MLLSICKSLLRWWGYLCEARRKGNFMLCVSPTAQLWRRNAWNSFETNQHSILFRQPFHNNTACSQGMHPGYHSLSLIWVQWLQPILLLGTCEWIDLCDVHKRSTEIHFQHDFLICIARQFFHEVKIWFRYFILWNGAKWFAFPWQEIDKNCSFFVMHHHFDFDFCILFSLSA